MPDEPRIKLAQREDLEGDALAAYDAVKEKIGMHALWQAMAHSPALANIAATGAYVVKAPNRAINELAICIASKEANCLLEYAAHRAFARKAGVPEETLAKLETPEIEQEPYPYGPVARFARLVGRGETVDDDTFNVLKENLGDVGVVNLLIAIGYYRLIASFIQQTGLAPIMEAATAERLRRKQAEQGD